MHSGDCPGSPVAPLPGPPPIDHGGADRI